MSKQFCSIITNTRKFVQANCIRRCNCVNNFVALWPSYWFNLSEHVPLVKYTNLSALLYALVHIVLLIGFHLSATVAALPPGIAVSSSSGTTAKSDQKVALVFDRRHITSCSCSCSSGATWCAHIVALCLFRIHQVSDNSSLSLVFYQW